jgi:hypothetical protein
MSPLAVEPEELFEAKIVKPRNALAVQWSLRLVGAFVLVAGVLLLSSWTLHYWQAVAYLLAFFVPLTVVSFVLLASTPAAIQRLITVELNH